MSCGATNMRKTKIIIKQEVADVGNSPTYHIIFTLYNSERLV